MTIVSVLCMWCGGAFSASRFCGLGLSDLRGSMGDLSPYQPPWRLDLWSLCHCVWFDLTWKSNQPSTTKHAHRSKVENWSPDHFQVGIQYPMLCSRMGDTWQTGTTSIPTFNSGSTIPAVGRISPAPLRIGAEPGYQCFIL